MSENNQDDKSPDEKNPKKNQDPKEPSQSPQPDLSAPKGAVAPEAPITGTTSAKATSRSGAETAAGTAHTARTSPGNASGRAESVSRATPDKARGKGSLAVLWLLVIALVVAVGYLGWHHWLMASNGDLAARQQVLNRLEQNLSATDGELDDLRRDLETRFMQAEQRAAVRDEEVRDRLRDQQAQLNDLSGNGRNDWILSEADYLLRLASHRLLVDRDVVVATTLLQSIDQLLQEQDDPQTFRLRQALASDLSALRLVERVDRTGLYLRIDALQQAVAELPLERHLHERGEELEFAGEAGAVQPATTWWQGLTGRLKTAWGHLDDYIRIYRRDQPLQPLLSPDEELYLRLNLRLMLEQAQLALLQQEQGAYEISLNKAQAWLQDYFVDDERNQRLQDELHDLSQHAVVQVLPDLEDSLNAMRQLLRAQSQQDNPAESSS